MSDIVRPYRPIITGIPGAQPVQKQQAQPTVQPETSFRELLEKSLHPQALTFSKHAQARAAERNIPLEQADLDRLDAAAQAAQEKGLTDTLVFMNNTAFIVNIPGKVVVTIVEGSDTEPQVFTNINGAVIV